MVDFLHGASDSIFTALSTGLNNLINTDTNISSALSNDAASTERRTGIVLELVLASLTSVGVGKTIDVWIVYEIDGTNYGDGSDSRAPDKMPHWTFHLQNATGTHRQVSDEIPLLPYNYKLLLRNNSGLTLASSGNTLKARTVFKVG